MKPLVVLAILAMASPAHAEEPSWAISPPALTPPARPAQMSRHWYGHQIILVDLLSVGVIVAGAAGESATPATIGLLGLWLGAPAVHIAHGENGRAVASFFMRPGGVVLGAYAGYHAEDCSNGGEWCGLGGLLLGGLVGFGVAAVADAAWAYEWRVTPIIQPRGETYGLGLASSF